MQKDLLMSLKKEGGSQRKQRSYYSSTVTLIHAPYPNEICMPFIQMHNKETYKQWKESNEQTTFQLTMYISPEASIQMKTEQKDRKL